MLKWTVGQKQQNTTSSTSGSSTVQSSSPGPCYPICRTNVKFPVKPRTRRVSIHQLNKENRQCRKSVDNSSSNKQQKANSGETGTPRTRDSVYMRLDTLPAALRDVSNHYSPRLDSAGLSDSTNRVQRRRSYTKRQTKSPCSVPLHHRVQRRKSEPPYFIHEDNDEAEKKETSKAEVKSAPIPSPSNSPKKKQPCTEAHRYLTDFEKRKPFSSMQVELSPAVSNSRAAVPNTLNLGGKIGDQLEFPHHNHSRIANLTMAPGPTRYENPVSFTLDLSPPAEPDLLLHKELPITKTFNKPQIPRKLLQELQKVQLEAQSAVKEILLNSSGDFRDKKSKECQSGIVNKGTPCDVSPLARKLAWLRLNTQQPRSNLLGVCQEEDESLKQLPQSNISNRDYLSAIKTNIFNLDDRLDNLDDIKNSSKTNNDRLIENLLAKRRGICFNEHKFLLNTPFCNGNKENDSNRIISGTGNVEKTSLIDDNTPSTLKRQKVIRRRRRDTNLGCKEDFESLTKIPRRRVLSSSLLTLPDGIPSPFTQINGGAVELNGSTIGFYCTPEADHMRPGFILLDDSAVSTSTNNNNSSSHNKNNNLNTATNISVDSKSVLSIEGIEPLDKDQTPTPNLSCLNNDSSKVDTKSTDVPIMDDTLELTRKKNHWKRKLKQKKLKFEDTDQDLNVSSAESSCSDDTWDSHGMRLKTPRFATNFSPTFSFIAPGSSFASSIDKTDTTQTSSDVSSQQIASSPETLSERQSRSRRCLLFPSPGSSSRSKCKTVNHGLAWKRAKDKSTPQKAELELSLSLQNLSLTVHIKRGKNLSKASDNSPVNAYVKVNLVPSGSEKAYHRTCVRKDSTNPKFDQKFIMNLSEADLSKRILLSVWHRDRGKRKSEFLGCMSFAIKTVAEKEISGSFRFLAQGLNKTYHVLSTTPQNTDVMADQSESSVEETLSAEENPTSTHVPDAKSNIKEDLKSDPENSLFLRHLELDPLGSQNESRKGGRTPFTTTRELTKPPGQSFGFSIAWTHPPRVERVELGMPADRAGLRPGDFVVFINKVNVVTLPEEDVLSLIKACCNQLTIEVYRKIVPNGTINRGSTPGPPNTVPEKTVASVPPRSVSSPGAVGLPSNGDPHSKSRLHLPQISFTTEGRESGACILLNIEEEYALCLQFGISRFLLPLAERRDLINQHQHQTLFQNAQELLRLTEDVIEHLVQEEGDAFGTNVGLVYLNKMNVLCSAYRKYCIGLKKADCLLVEKTRNKEFMKLLSEPPIPRKRPDLTTFIHKPLEHFREVLKQLQNVQNSTNSKDPDYQSISKVVQQFQSSYREMTLKSGLMEPEGDGRPLLSVQDLESRLVFTRCKPFVVSAPGREWIFGGDLSRVEGRRIRSFWAILFSDLLVFAKVSRDRVLFITEEPLQLKTVKQALFNIRKKATEFRLLINMSKNNDDGNESPESEVTGCGLPDFTHTPRKSVRTRSVALRAPTLELKAVWQNLIQRQIIYLNTKARGRTPGSSPSDTPDSPSEQVHRPGS